jgi:pyruvate formate lyase activating enzyme
MNTKNKTLCDLCPRMCQIPEGGLGFCKARMAENGKIKPLSYGKLVALALDPIEKKPLAFFHPGSTILSAGTFGCNMNCPFCQNFQLARAGSNDLKSYDISPKDLVNEAISLKDHRNIGIAFTYNEPCISFEYVRDTFLLAKKEKLETILVTNGQINDKYLQVLLPLTSAWNIDLKAFSQEAYKKLGGDLDTTLNTIKKASESSHLEITTLIVPGISDNLEDFKKEVDFIAKIDPNIPLHLTRYFPNYHYEEPQTSLSTMKDMKEIADKKLSHVRLGNV